MILNLIKVHKLQEKVGRICWRRGPAVKFTNESLTGRCTELENCSRDARCTEIRGEFHKQNVYIGRGSERDQCG